MVIMVMKTFSRKGRTKMRPGPRTKAMSRVEPKTTARSYSGIWMVVMVVMILDVDQQDLIPKSYLLIHINNPF